MLVIPSVAATRMLDACLNSVTPYFHLYLNDLTPDVDTILADFTEPVGDWYGPLIDDTFSPAIWDGQRAVSYADQIRWVSGGTIPPSSVYGYFVTDGAAGALLWCERRPQGPLDISSPGTPVNLYPQIFLGPC